jgi:hypothetical protein
MYWGAPNPVEASSRPLQRPLFSCCQGEREGTRLILSSANYVNQRRVASINISLKSGTPELLFFEPRKANKVASVCDDQLEQYRKHVSRSLGIKKMFQLYSDNIINCVSVEGFRAKRL